MHNFPPGDSMAFGVGNLVDIFLGHACNTDLALGYHTHLITYTLASSN